MEQNQGVDEILRYLRVSFLQLHNLFLSQPHKDERLWESCQHKFIFVGKYMVDMTTDVTTLDFDLPSVILTFSCCTGQSFRVTYTVLH